MSRRKDEKLRYDIITMLLVNVVYKKDSKPVKVFGPLGYVGRYSDESSEQQEE